MVIKWLRSKIDHYNQVISEGNYQLPPMTWTRLITGVKPAFEIPSTPDAAVATTMIDTGKKLGERFLWAFSVAALGAVALKWAAIAFGVAGVSVYTLEYFRAKKSREDEITETNFAGQRVKGKRSDLYRLRHAQLQVMNITDKLGQVDSTTEDAISKIVDSVKEERARVIIVDRGRYKASETAYDFREPDFRFVKEEPEFEDKSAVRLDTLSLRPAWDSKRVSSDEIVERLAALQEALPDDLQERLKERLARNLPPPPAPKPAAASPASPK